MTVNVAPLIFTLPVREALAVFAATVKPTEPFPLPLVVVSVIQDTVLLAVQGHQAFAVTPIVPEPPPPGIDVDDCCSEMLHERAGAGPAAD